MDILKETGDIEQSARSTSSLKVHLDAFIEGFRKELHRFNSGRDLAVFFWMIRRALEDFGSIENAFLNGLPEAPSDALDTGAAMDHFSSLMLGFGHEHFYPKGELAKRTAVRFSFRLPGMAARVSA
jgi:hypothetical protein